MFNRFYKVDTAQDVDFQVCEATFRAAFLSLQNVSLSRRKGNFSSCELCLIATDLLCKCRNKAHRDIINNYRYAHLHTQQGQRNSMTQVMKESEMMDSNNQPMKAFILSDAITKYRGDTPKIKSTGKGAYKTDDHKKVLLTECLVHLLSVDQ